MADTIAYDAQQKIWRCRQNPYTEFVKQTIGAVFLKNIESTPPGKVVETYFDTSLQRTMGEIHQEAFTVAINLQRLGVKQGDILVINSMVNVKVSALTLGSLLMGVTLNFFETQFDKEQTEHTLQLLSPTVVVYEERYSKVLKAAVANVELPKLRYLLSIDGSASDETVEQTLFKPVAQAEIDSFVPPTLGDPTEVIALLALTSGSTGMPKAVALSHSYLLHGVTTFWYDAGNKIQLRLDSAVFSFSPLRWISQIDLMLLSLLLGVRRVCATGDAAGPYGREIIRVGGITHFFSVPSVFKDILLATEPTDMDALQSLRIIYIGGEAPSEFILNLAAKRAPRAIAFRCYGMTELAGCISNDETVNGGYLIPGLELKVLNDKLEPVGPNVNGQLCLRTPVPALGYYKMSKSLAVNADGFFNTGDYGYMNDNNALIILGRYKDLIRTKNVILIPSEVERLVKMIPEIFDAVLVGYRLSTEDTEDVGDLFLTLEANIKKPHDIIKADIRSLLEIKLKQTQYKIIRSIHIINKYPLTVCGKVDKVALVKIAKSA